MGKQFPGNSPQVGDRLKSGYDVALAIAPVMALGVKRLASLSTQQRHMLKFLKSQRLGAHPHISFFRVCCDIGEKAESPLLVPHRNRKCPVRGQRRGDLIAVRSRSLAQTIRQPSLRSRRAGPAGQGLDVLPFHGCQLWNSVAVSGLPKRSIRAAS